MKDLAQEFLMAYGYVEVYGLTVLYFLLLYFGIGWLFQKCCEGLEGIRLVERVILSPIDQVQRSKEMLNSLLSIFVFGFSAWPIRSEEHTSELQSQ